MGHHITVQGLAIDTWYHVAVTFNTTDGMVMYLDGSAVDTNGDTNTNHHKQHNDKDRRKRLEHRKTSSMVLLDEVHVYDTALTALEVQDLVGNNNVGYMAHYALEGNANDSSGNGNHGTVNGGAVWTATGKVGGALDFDGVDDYVDIGDIDLTDAFTIAAWIKLSSDGKYTIVGKSYSTYQFIVSSTGNLVFHRNSSGAISYNAGLAIDTWYHVAVTFNTTDGMVMYLNGSAVATDGDITTTVTNNTPTKIGARAWTAKDFFHGILDEVYVYDTALTAQEVLGLFNN